MMMLRIENRPTWGCLLSLAAMTWIATAPSMLRAQAGNVLAPSAAASTQPLSNADLERRVAYLRPGVEQSVARFEEDLARPGARFEARQFAIYAHWSLVLGQDPAKAEAALKRLLALHDNNPQSRTYGEFAPAEGQRPTEGSAATEFTCLPLVQIVLGYGEKLSPEMRDALTERMKATLSAIRRRKITPDLSNVFLTNAAVMLLMGEIIRDDKAIADAQSRLMQFVVIARSRGVEEYCAPNQTATQITALQVAQRYTLQPEARKSIDPALNFIWAHLAANTLIARGTMGGPHSRDTDFVHGTGAVDTFLFLEGLRELPPQAGAFSDGLRAVVNRMEGASRPDASILALAHGERVVKSRWGTQLGQDRYHYVTDDFAIGSASATACPYDKKLTVDFPSQAMLPTIWVVPDPFDAPYGRIQRNGQPMHPAHLSEQIAAVQEKGAMLALMNLGGAGNEMRGKWFPSVATNVVFPIEADEVLLDGRRVTFEKEKPIELPAKPESTLVIRHGTGAVGIRFFAIDGMEGQQPVHLLKFDGNPWGVGRLVGYHYRGDSSRPRPFADKPVRAGVFYIAASVRDTQELEAFAARVTAAKIEQTVDGRAWRAKLTDGETVLEAGLDLQSGNILARKVNGQEYQPAVFKVNDRDLASELLGW